MPALDCAPVVLGRRADTGAAVTLTAPTTIRTSSVMLVRVIIYFNEQLPYIVELMGSSG